MSQYEVTTLKKGLQIIELLKEQNGLSLTEITKHLELSKTTAFRMLATLEEMGYVQKFQSRFEINHKMFCEHFERRIALDWVSLTTPYKVAKEIGESLYIGKMDGTNLVTVHAVLAPYKEPAREEIGNRSFIHQSALGKIILANLPSKTQSDILRKLNFTKATDHAFEDAHLFVHHLNVIQKQGYAFDDEERIVGIRCIAVPLFLEGEIIASIAIAAPAVRITKGKRSKIYLKLMEGSEKITREIESLR
ncbi:IclR family transcriptional regulator C-terminal domain-containing protein [Psychrobacillus sp. FSL H8-0483]|uniref:IclR family transcriptional regulator n=1 Tax=Psychrobacillus sp. FSL H8-0483 TaxID=2921389 RepID=UPI00315A066A